MEVPRREGPLKRHEVEIDQSWRSREWRNAGRDK